MLVTLLHERADAEPQAVDESELVFDEVTVGVARVWIVPLVRTESSEYKQRQTDHDVRRQHVDPHLHHPQQRRWWFGTVVTLFVASTNLLYCEPARLVLELVTILGRVYQIGI